jgi:repressor LexA
MYTLSIMKISLTKRQASILAFLKSYLQEKGYPPTVREIAAHFHISTPRGAKKHLDILESKGYIQKRPGSPRAIELRDGSRATRNSASGELPIFLPIIGRVRAGAPNLATQEIMGHLALDPSLTPGPDAFILQVRGNSMVEDSILEGDYALVKPQDHAANGDIVVALVGDEATVKRFYWEKNQVRLEPANARLKPIVVTAHSEEFRILGKVVGIVRKL